MVDWKYVRISVTLLSAQLFAIVCCCVIIGLIVCAGITVGFVVVLATLLFLLVFNDVAPSEVARFKIFLVLLVQLIVNAVLFNFPWIVVVAWIIVMNYPSSTVLFEFVVDEGIVGVVICLSFIVLVKFVVDEIYASVYSLDTPPAELGPIDENWDLVAMVRSSNNGYGSKQFKGVIVCDSMRNSGDRFEPEHTSFVHLVEFRRRSVFVKEIVVWRVSVVSGAQCKTPVGREWFVDFDLPSNRHFESGHVRCFESRGVVFVFVEDQFVFICDTCNNVTMLTRHEFRLRDDIVIKKIVSVMCLERMVNPSGKVNGWKIRLLTAFVDDQYLDEEGVWVPTLVKYDMEMCKANDQPIIIDESWKELDKFDEDDKTTLWFVRTSDGMFGIYAESEQRNNGPVLFYDHDRDVFLYCDDLDELRRFDRPFNTYYRRHNSGDGVDLCPAVLNDRECIIIEEDGRIRRMEIAPATALYTAAKRIFRADPSLKSRINADEYRQLVGVNRMKVHFESR